MKVISINLKTQWEKIVYYILVICVEWPLDQLCTGNESPPNGCVKQGTVVPDLQLENCYHSNQANALTRPPPPTLTFSIPKWNIDSPIICILTIAHDDNRQTDRQMGI